MITIEKPYLEKWGGVKPVCAAGLRLPREIL